MNTEKLISTVEAAKQLAVSPDTLKAWRRTKALDLPVIKLGRKVMYRQSDIDAVKDGKTIKGGSVINQPANQSLDKEGVHHVTITLNLHFQTIPEAIVLLKQALEELHNAKPQTNR